LQPATNSSGVLSHIPCCSFFHSPLCNRPVQAAVDPCHGKMVILVLPTSLLQYQPDWNVSIGELNSAPESMVQNTSDLPFLIADHSFRAICWLATLA